MRESADLSAWILAGGASSRMGRNKALLEIAGKPILVRTAQLLSSHTDRVTVVGPAGPYDALGWPVIQDVRTGAGPLSGLVTALAAAATEWNLVVGCDLPYLTSEWIAWLLMRRRETNAQAVVPEAERGLEPLCALYKKDCHETLAAALARGALKLQDAVATLAIERIGPAKWRRFDATGMLLTSMNTPEDYESARREVKQ